MVIGNGMIARAFSDFMDEKDMIIFCSGVSNSMETDPKEFEREMNLIKCYLEGGKKFIYFSSTSVVDGSPSTPYIEHKLYIEEYISKNHSDYLIFRLPIVLSFNSNSVTFFNFIKNRIINNEHIIIRDVCRYVIDIEDVKFIVSELLKKGVEKNRIINICFDNFYKVSELVNMMEISLRKTANKKFENYSPNHKVENNYISKNFNHLYDNNYTSRVIEKYCTNPF